MVLRSLTLGLALVLATACAAPSEPLPSAGAGSGSVALPQGWQSIELPGATTASPNPYDVGTTLVAGSIFSPDQSLLTTPTVKLTGDAPWGILKVDALTPDLFATVSIASLRNQLFDVDKDRSAHPSTSKVIQQAPLEQTGMYGERLIYSTVLTQKGAVPTSVTLDQTVYLAPSASRVYLLFVACTSDCYQAYQSTIDQVVSSWDPTTV